MFTYTSKYHGVRVDDKLSSRFRFGQQWYVRVVYLGSLCQCQQGGTQYISLGLHSSVRNSTQQRKTEEQYVQQQYQVSICSKKSSRSSNMNKLPREYRATEVRPITHLSVKRKKAILLSAVVRMQVQAAHTHFNIRQPLVARYSCQYQIIPTGYIGVHTRVPNMVVLVILGYVPGYRPGVYSAVHISPATKHCSYRHTRVYTQVDTLLHKICGLVGYKY